MYLKRLELKGFKSFPTKTDILFKEGITAIVGPNGSGKSNISDAVRWVLGEQSVKSLRGDKLEDVIFAGSDNKKPMNYCEVALTIDNEDDKLGIGFSEVSIKRRAYRNGESQFYLNNKICRLKDIKEILLDTGIGKDGYSIIEQGKVDEILSSNPVNRRKVFDEACGISKFRYKKNEAERNLKNTKENLERIDDIYVEIENQLNPLYQQQLKAKKYIDLKEELKVIEINNYIREINSLDIQIKGLDESTESLNNDIKEVEKEKESLEKNIETANNDISNIDDAINKSIEYINTIKSVISNKESQIEILKEKQNTCNENISRTNEEIKNNEEMITSNKDVLINLEKEYENNTNDIQIIKEDISKIETKNKDKKDLIKNLNTEVEDLKDSLISLLNQKQEVTNKLSALTANKENVKNREDIIDVEVKNLEDNIYNKNNVLKELNEQYENNKLNLNQVNDNKLKLENEINNITININKAEKDIQNKTYLLKEYKSKLNVYVDMENHYEGFNRGVKEVLKNKNLQGIYGALGQVISVSQRYEKAIEASLGAYMQNIITKDEQSAKVAINYLKKNNLGRVTFLPSNIIKSNKIDEKSIRSNVTYIGIASDLIQFDDKYKNILESILGRTIVIDNIDDAIKLARETNHRYKIVTLDGEILNPGGSLTGGSLRTSGNILSRKRLINEYKEKINLENGNINNLESQRVSFISNLDSNKKLLLKISNEINQIQELINKNSSNIAMIKYEVKTLNESLGKLNDEKDGLTSNLEYINNKTASLNQSIIDMESNHKATENKIKELSESLSVNSLEYEVEKESYDKLNLGLVKVIQIKNNMESEISRVKRENQTLEGKIQNSKSDLDKYKVDFENHKTQLNIDITEKGNLENQLTENNKKLNQKQLTKQNLKENLDSILKAGKGIDRKYMEVKEAQFKLESKLDRVKSNKDNYLSNLFEDYQLTFLDAIEFKNEDVVVSKKIIENIKRQIKSLGNVNVDSILEYEQVKERYDFYSEQRKDLQDSIEVIETLIHDLEENMKIEFSNQFSQINDNFKYVYKRLFGGGHGELKIVDEENILESDIEITAQPPGKKTKNLNLLSGGEKALTAISILFSIILAKPTPFCILDEIEAPLDDANIFRFGEFLKELAKDTQFISVTHRRGTMEAANYIYGVTMQEKAVSKVISLQLDEAKEITDAI